MTEPTATTRREGLLADALREQARLRRARVRRRGAAALTLVALPLAAVTVLAWPTPAPNPLPTPSPNPSPTTPHLAQRDAGLEPYASADVQTAPTPSIQRVRTETIAASRIVRVSRTSAIHTTRLDDHGLAQLLADQGHDCGVVRTPDAVFLTCELALARPAG